MSVDKTITLINEGSDDRVRPFETCDVRLASALMAMGVRPVGSEPVRIITRAHRPGDNRQFIFEAVSQCGAYNTRALLRCWKEGASWIELNPEHPFSYIMAAHLNHNALLDYVKSATRQVFLERGKSIALLPANASAGLEEKILGKF